MRTLFASAIAAVVLHITPTVILVKRADAVSQLLPGADQFFAREAHLNTMDLHRLSEEASDWSPPNGVLTFYVGKQGSKEIGVLEFLRVDTPHGPMEVAVGFSEDHTVRGVLVTQVTTETKPWVLTALQAGLTDHYRGLKPAEIPDGAGAIKAQVGELPDAMAHHVDEGVHRALVGYREFYLPSPSNVGTANQ